MTLPVDRMITAPDAYSEEAERVPEYDDLEELLRKPASGDDAVGHTFMRAVWRRLGEVVSHLRVLNGRVTTLERERAHEQGYAAGYAAAKTEAQQSAQEHAQADRSARSLWVTGAIGVAGTLIGIGGIIFALTTGG